MACRPVRRMYPYFCLRAVCRFISLVCSPYIRIEGSNWFGSLRFWQMGFNGAITTRISSIFLYTAGEFCTGCGGTFDFFRCFLWLYFFYIWLLYEIKSKTWSWRNGPCLRLRCCVLHSIVRLFLIEILFYTNRFHASYILEGKGRLGFGVPLAFLLQCVAFALQYHRYAELVLGPFLERRRAHDQPEPVKGKQIPGTDPPVSRKIPVVRLCRHYIIICVAVVDLTPVHRWNCRTKTEVKIGKDPARCQIVIDRGYKKVSRVHCGVLRKGKSFYVRDYSTNGTFRSAGDKRMQSGGAWNALCADQIFNLAQTDNSFLL